MSVRMIVSMCILASLYFLYGQTMPRHKFPLAESLQAELFLHC